MKNSQAGWSVKDEERILKKITIYYQICKDIKRFGVEYDKLQTLKGIRGQDACFDEEK